MPRGRPRTSPTTEPDSLDTQLATARVAELAGERTLAEGQSLFRQGAVRNLAIDSDRATAAVHDGIAFYVTLTVAPKGPQFDCLCADCLEDGEFCKHCAAVAVAYQSEHLGVQSVAIQSAVVPERRPTAKPRRNKAATVDDLRLYLQEREPHELIALILDRAQVDLEWRKSLLLMVAAGDASANSVDIATLKKAILSATKHRGNLDATRLRVYLRQIQEIEDVLQQLSARGEASACRQLAVYAIDLLVEKRGTISDSTGKLTAFIERLLALHRTACLESPPDPAELARDLYEREKKGNYYGFWDQPAERYAASLGAPGLAEYRRLLDDEWATVPAMTPNDQQSRQLYDARRQFLTHRMTTYARESGDIDALIAVLERDLTHPSHFLALATINTDAGRNDEALRWSERGVAAFGTQSKEDLVSFLVEALGQRGQTARALQVLWEQFASKLSVRSYQAVHDYALPLGIWPERRTDALALMHKKIAKEKSARPLFFHIGHESASARLIEMYLWEGETDAAWSAAKEYGSSDRQWIALATARAGSHPEDALETYRQIIPKLVNALSDDPIIETSLQSMQALLQRLGRAGEFSAFTANLRASFKRRRQISQMLDRNRW